MDNGVAALLAAVAADPVLKTINLMLFDVAGVYSSVLANPLAFGFTNTTAACITGGPAAAGTVCSDPSQYVFWDPLHPTTAAHAIIGAAALARVPEPASIALLVIGLAGLACARTRRGAALSRPG